MERSPHGYDRVVPRDASLTFIGRQLELDRLEAAWKRAAQGEPRILLIGGDAGIGKTRLLREYASRAADQRVVASGGCVPIAGGSLPYVPFVEILRELMSPAVVAQVGATALGDIPGPARAELGRLVPTLRAPQPDASSPDDPLRRGRLFEAVYGLLLQWSARKPLLLVVEDLHWADGSSLDLLGYLIRNLDAERILIAASYRTDELHRRHPLRRWISEIGRLDIAERIELTPLATDDLRSDVAAMLELAADDQLVERIVRRAGGNPLFATELVASTRRGADPRALPGTIRDGFLERLGQLRPDALLAVRHAAVFGRPVTERLLAASTRLPPDRLAAAIRDALDAQVLTIPTDAEADRFEPRHALLGEAIADDLLPAERTALHAEIAAVLESGADGGGDADPARIAAEVAHHRWQAHDRSRAVAASVRAAVTAAQALAYTEADAHWTRVLEAWPSDPGIEGFDGPSALVEAANVAAAVGDHRRAGQLASQALTMIDARADPMRAAEVHRRIIWYHLHTDWRSAVIHSGQAARLIPAVEASPGAARILADRAVVMALRLHIDRAEKIARRALDLAERHHRSDAKVQALQALGNCMVGRSQHQAAIDVLTEAYELAHDIGDAEGLMNAGLALGWSLNDAGLWNAALEHCDRVDGRIRELGLALRYGAEMVDHRLWALESLGRWAELEAIAQASLTNADPEVGRGPMAFVWLAILRVRQGRLDDARRLVAPIEALDEVADIEPIDWSLDPWCEIALADGDWARARRVVATAFERVPVRVRAWEPDLRRFAIYGLQAEVELAMDARIRRDPGGEIEAVETARRLGTWMRGLAARVTDAREPLAATTLADAALAEALLTMVERKPDPAVWWPALERYQALGHPYRVAQVRRWVAESILESGGSRTEASSELGLAVTGAVEIGATVLQQQVRAIARRARLELKVTTDGDAASLPAANLGDEPKRVDRRPLSGRPTELIEPLTPREREVLGYLAAGWTNRRIGEALFISDKTVSVHVSNLLGKLGAANRAEAALIGDRLGLAAAPEQA